MKAIRFLAAAVLCVTAWQAGAQSVRIGSERGVDTRIKIAVPAFTTTDPSLLPLARELAVAVADDLAFSGLFVLLPGSQYPAGFMGFEPDVSKVDLVSWKKTTAENLVFGRLVREGGQIQGEFHLFDLLASTPQQVVGKRIGGSEAQARQIAHAFSEEIIKYTDGIPGIGTTEICFSGGPMGKKELYIADYDGANLRQLTSYGSITINPQLSPDGTKIAFMSYKDRYAYLYVMDRKTGQTTPLSKEVGLNSSPAWAPDGKTVALTLSKDGNSEIYLRNWDGSNPRRLTKNTHSDTSPCFSPDGNYIAWVADIGTPQIQVMRADGTGARRLSFQGGNSYDPAWSPDGRYIAYVVEQRGEGLEIYVMNADGTNPRKLTNTQGSNEAPCWSPDSRHIVFTSTRTGTSQLWFVTLETGQEQPMPRVTIRSEGATWGPRRR